jgi:glycosyltransferase involved in cell wall biosynthesis
MKSSIVHVITTIDLGGAEKQLLTLAECQRRNGKEVQVVFLKGHPSLLREFREAGIKVSTEFSVLNFVRQLLTLRKQSNLNGAIFHAHLPRSELLCALALRPKSFVVTRHNAEPFFPKAPRFLSRMLSRFVLKRSYACISISHAVESYLKVSKEAPVDTKLFVIHYGMQDDFGRRERFDDLTNLEKKQIGTISRLVPQKNIPLILQAMHILTFEKERDFYLTVAGTGHLERDLRSMSIRLGIEKNVDWAGKVFQIEEFYKKIHVFVLSSDYEGFGLVLLEAMFYGVPVVARKVSAIPEVLGFEHPGLLVTDRPEELAAKIDEFLLDLDARNNCLSYQANQILKFSISDTRVLHDKVYECLLAGD